MGINKELNYQLFVQRENNFYYMPYQREMQVYADIASGNSDAVNKDLNYLKNEKGKGKLSDDPLRNEKYHFVVTVALASRFCIESGLSQDVAYSMSDIYIQLADKCQTVDEVHKLFDEMAFAFTEKMKENSTNGVISLHIKKAVDYIYEHLHENITLKAISEFLKLNPTYISKLFVKETGMTINKYITNAKIQTAKNMLKYSDASSSDIAMTLGFSTQSYFISQFKRYTGITPKEYRNRHYKENLLEKE